MSLLDFLKKPKAAEPPGPDGDAAVVLRARAHARQRLIGAAVLLVSGVIGFPLLFETRPRPIPADIPIEIPPKEGAKAAVAPPPPRAAGPVVMEPSPAQAAPASHAPAAPAEALVPVAPPAVAPTPAPAPLAAAAAPVAPAAAPASAAAHTRYVVQVGAFADANAARAARLRVEKLGLKTFTQEIQKDGARRIRVRVGPYATKAEAERAAKTIQKGDLPAAVLLL
jgi:DedD protein